MAAESGAVRRGGARAVFLAALFPAALLACGQGSFASEAGSCGSDGAQAAVVRTVTAELGLALADGRLVRLVGIDPVRATADRPLAPADARGTLAAWLEGATVLVRPLAGVADRWDRWPALVFAPATAGGGPALSVALAMVDAGLARGRPEAVAEACWPAVRDAEDGARVARLGLWNDPYYAVLEAGDRAALMHAVGRSVVVEGQVAHVGQTRSHVYLDFGDRRGAFAVRVARRDLFILGQGVMDQSGWVGRKVRVRGYLDDRGGPRIDVRDRAQLDVTPAPPAP